MSNSESYDLLIIGAGVAGLSLAMALVERQSSLQVKILESKTSFEDDKTWCFWDFNELPGYVSQLIKKRWYSWSTHSASNTYSQTSENHPYSMIRSSDFYHEAMSSVDSSHNISIDLGVAVSSLQDGSEQIRVVTPHGTYLANSVVDTRPSQLEKSDVAIVQSFWGIEVTAEQPIFKDNTAKLMHHLEANDSELNFIYVLPTSPNQALIEYTRFTQDTQLSTSMRQQCIDYIDEITCGIKYKIVREEKAVLPMQSELNSRHSSRSKIVRAGTAANALRGSTGYGFISINRWAVDCADHLAKQPNPVTSNRRRMVVRWMDHIFLRVMIHSPRSIRQLFLKMSHQLSGDRFARFMNEKATILDYFAIISVAPKWPFIKQLIAHLFGATPEQPKREKAKVK